MELKGELKRGGLPSLFRNFATENFSGVLTVSSSVGEKLITLSENEVTVYCDELNESSRLGNILLAREKVSLETIEQALKDQKKIEPRPMLGDMLVQRGVVTQQDCVDARRFQIEEDICDVLSWKNVRFHFAGRELARVIRPEDFAPDQVHRLTIDPDSFFKSVTRMTEEWETIGDRLPTQYLCFKLSSRVEEQKSNLTPRAQRILGFIGEGRPIEGVVKYSCLGRFEICVQVIEFLEKGLILPESGADLRFQASELRAQKRYHDALYVYRRLLESPETPEDRLYLENLIVEVSDLIRASKVGGHYGEEAVIVTHRSARLKFQAQRRVRSFIWASLVVVIIIAGAVLWIRRTQSISDLPIRQKELMTAVDAAERAHDFSNAKTILENFYNTLEDKEDATSTAVRERMRKLPGLIDNHVKAQLPVLEAGVKSDAEEIKKSIASLNTLRENFPNNKHTRQIDELIAAGEKKLKDLGAPKLPNTGVVEVPRAALLEKLTEAIKLQQESKFAAAELIFQEVARNAPATDVISKQADEGLKRGQAARARSKEEFEKAKEEAKALRGEEALALFAKIKNAYPDLEIAGQAASQELRLIGRKRTAQDLFKRAKEEEAQGKIYTAINTLVLLYETYSEFPIAETARTRKDELQGKGEAVRQELENALDLVAKGKWSEARDAFRKLLDKNYQLLVDKHVDIPVYVESIPSGSRLTVNGEAASGPTPQNILIPAGKPFEIVIERPGFKSIRVAKDRISAVELEIKLQLTLEPIVMDFKTPLYAPAVAFLDKPLIVAGPTLQWLNPPGKEPTWTLANLFNERDPIPEGAPVVPGEEKTFWNCRVAPQPFLPGKILLPMRNRDILEIDVNNPLEPKKSVLLRAQPAWVSGPSYFEEHSKLASRPLLVTPFTDGKIRVFADVDRYKGAAPAERWAALVDSSENAGREAAAAGPHACRGFVYVLSAGGRLSALDAVENREVWHQQFEVMSPRACFSTVPNDNLAALVHGNGKVILFDLDARQPVWQLEKRQAMQESVGALIDATGVFIATANNETGTLQLIRRKPSAQGKEEQVWSATLQGHVDIEMTRGKHIYLVTHLNRVFALEAATGRQLWEYKMDPELGRPLWIRAIGDFVYVGTATGKLLVLKAD